MSLTDKEGAERKSRILSIAFGEALKYTTMTTLAATAATLAATYRYKNFKQFTSTSIKLAIPTMVMLGSFSYFYETTVTDCLHRPERWGLTNEVIKQGKVTSMPFHHRIMNAVYDSPFYLVAGLGFPLAGGIFYQQMQNTHLTFSQKIMHSRVFAQGGILFILLSTMMFREYMNQRGRFPEHDEDQETETK
jgi:hypothetical protein